MTFTIDASYLLVVLALLFILTVLNSVFMTRLEKKSADFSEDVSEFADHINKACQEFQRFSENSSEDLRRHQKRLEQLEKHLRVISEETKRERLHEKLGTKRNP